MKLYLVFVLLSSGLWFMMKLTDRYNKEIPVNLHYIHAPEGYVPLHLPARQALVFVSAKGFKLLGVNSKHGEDVNIDMGELLSKAMQEGPQRVVMSPEKVQKAIEEALHVKISGAIKPDSFVFIFDRLDSTQVPIKLQADFQFIAGFHQYGPIIFEPEKVKVIGPKALVDTLSYVSNKEIIIKDLSADFSKNIQIIPPFVHARVEPDKVRISVKVVEYIEAETEVTIEVKNKIPGISIKTFPETVKVKYLVPMPDYPNISPEQFRVIVEPDSLSLLKHNKLILKVVNKPPEASNIRLAIDKVDYIMKRH